ncbi:hypothetical protein RHOSPDRAFT_31235 [Rhodotorula sp. JG-1b]|nr:hypothetical protein RHOSPDRAFT_31235 [Rhodotorula sp. JG-1b]
MSDEVPPFTLQVGSRWPAYNADNLIQIAFIQRGLAEGFPTSDFRPPGNTDRTPMGERLSFGCAYFLTAEVEGSCTYGFDLDPGVNEPFACKRITDEEEEAYLPKGIAAVQEGAIDRLLELRKTLDFRCGDPESLKEYLDSKIQEQDFIIKSWDLIPDARARTELRRQTERILIRRENYPILPRLPPRGFTFSTSRPVPRASSSSSVSTSTRASQAPAPGPERKAKRAASPSPELEAKPARKNPRRKAAQPPTVEKSATPQPASGSSTPAASSSRPQADQTPHQGMRSPVAPVDTIDLCDSSDEDIKPDLGTPAHFPRPTPPAAGPSNAPLTPLNPLNLAPLSPATPATPTRVSKLADFLSSLEPDRHLERYHALFGRSNLEISDPEQLLQVDGIKGMPRMWGSFADFSSGQLDGHHA